MQEITIVDIVNVLREKKKMILVVFLVCFLGIIIISMMVPSYTKARSLIFLGTFYSPNKKQTPIITADKIEEKVLMGAYLEKLKDSKIPLDKFLKVSVDTTRKKAPILQKENTFIQISVKSKELQEAQIILAEISSLIKEDLDEIYEKQLRRITNEMSSLGKQKNILDQKNLIISKQLDRIDSMLDFLNKQKKQSSMVLFWRNFTEYQKFSLIEQEQKFEMMLTLNEKRMKDAEQTKSLYYDPPKISQLPQQSLRMSFFIFIIISFIVSFVVSTALAFFLWSYGKSQQ